VEGVPPIYEGAGSVSPAALFGLRVTQGPSTAQRAFAKARTKKKARCYAQDDRSREGLTVRPEKPGCGHKPRWCTRPKPHKRVRREWLPVVSGSGESGACFRRSGVAGRN
jgi:hypothetical protein